MAVANQWADASLEAGKRANPAVVAGGEVVAIAGSIAIAAADDDGSIYKIAKIPSNYIPLRFEFNCAAITGATDYDLGFYQDDGSTVVDKDILMDGANIAAGLAIGSEQNGLANLGVSNLGKKIWDLLGLTVDNKKEMYVLAVTANTVGSAAGTLYYRGWFLKG